MSTLRKVSHDITAMSNGLIIIDPRQVRTSVTFQAWVMVCDVS